MFLTEDKPLCYLDIPCVSFNSFQHRLLVPLFFILCDLPVKQVSCLWSHIFLPCPPIDVKSPYTKSRNTETAQVKPPEHKALQGRAEQLIHSLQQGIVEFPSKLFFHRLCSVPRKINICIKQENPGQDSIKDIPAVGNKTDILMELGMQRQTKVWFSKLFSSANSRADGFQQSRRLSAEDFA